MAVSEITASNFTLTSRWTNGGTPSEESTTLSFAYSLPSAAVINSTQFTLTNGNPNTGIYYVTANNVSMGNYFNTTYTKTLTNPTALSGTYNVTVKYRANGNTGTGSGACAFTGIKLTINYTINSYNVTTSVSPAGGGTLTASPTSAAPGATVTLSRTASSGYVFSRYGSSPSVTINSSGQFTMPSSAVTVTAYFLKLSTGSVNTKSLIGGDSTTLTITPGNSGFWHSVTLSFGTGMTYYRELGVGVTSHTISIPESWSDAIPNAASKTGGTLTLTTYSGTTALGSTTITGFTYSVPASVVPTIGTVTTGIQRTVDGITYANVGDYYVQAHCGVSISATASGARSSTITGMSIAVSGYTDAAYRKTSTSGSISLDSGLLTNSGTTTITVTATDSRGRTATSTTTITVTAYSNPAASLDAWRVDVDGDADPMGTYGKFTITFSYTQVGTNALQRKELTSNGATIEPNVNTGDLLPGNRQTFAVQNEYQITFVVQDAFETTTVTKKIPTGRFVIFVSSDGSRIGFMRATSSTPIPAGKQHMVEFSADSQIYIGSETLEDYIRRIANS